MTLARREIRERHFVSAANFGVHLVNLGGESVRRKPFGHRVGIEKGLVNFFGRRPEDAVKSNRVVLHVYFPFKFESQSPLPSRKPPGLASCGIDQPK